MRRNGHASSSCCRPVSLSRNRGFAVVGGGDRMKDRKEHQGQQTADVMANQEGTDQAKRQRRGPGTDGRASAVRASACPSEGEGFQGNAERLLALFAAAQGSASCGLRHGGAQHPVHDTRAEDHGECDDELFEGVKAGSAAAEAASIDFGYLANILIVLIVLYVFSSLFAYFQQYLMAGVAQRTVYEMRRAGEREAVAAAAAIFRFADRTARR